MIPTAASHQAVGLGYKPGLARSPALGLHFSCAWLWSTDLGDAIGNPVVYVVFIQNDNRERFPACFQILFTFSKDMCLNLKGTKLIHK